MSSSNNQTIEQLTVRYTSLNEQRISAQRDLHNAENQLSKLKDHAMATWGTDDLDILDKKLQEMRTNNEKKRADYQKHLDDIEAKLKLIEGNEINNGTHL